MKIHVLDVQRADWHYEADKLICSVTTNVLYVVKLVAGDAGSEPKRVQLGVFPLYNVINWRWE